MLLTHCQKGSKADYSAYYCPVALTSSERDEIMTSSHSYSDEFYCVEGSDPYDPNTWGNRCNLSNQLARMQRDENEDFRAVCELATADLLLNDTDNPEGDVIDPDGECVLWDLLYYVKDKVNTVDGLHGEPTTVWLDHKREHTVEVSPSMVQCPKAGCFEMYHAKDSIRIVSRCTECNTELEL